MKSEEESTLEEVFKLILEASEKLWEAVAVIDGRPTSLATPFVSAIMTLRGNMHVDFLRPIYKKYPDIARKFGLDEVADES